MFQKSVHSIFVKVPHLGTRLQRLHPTNPPPNPMITNNSVVTFHRLQRVTKQEVKSYSLINQ